MRRVFAKGSVTVEQFLERKRQVRREPTVAESVERWLRLHPDPNDELAPDGLPYALGPLVRRTTR